LKAVKLANYMFFQQSKKGVFWVFAT